jgi:gliding motility-associated-like protein
LYQIDGGELQRSNVFSNISSGTHTITVLDELGCTNISEEVLIIDYPKFFTPNGDGSNDTWNIVGLNDQSNSKILIYDRYGKLLKQITTRGEGCDGTFNGYELPATDYWFTIDYLENNINKVFKAHFSLKR